LNFHVPRFGRFVRLGLGAMLLAGCGGGGSGSSDAQAPTVALTVPANFADNLSGTVTLSATAADNVGVASVEFQLDGKTFATTSSGPPYQANLVTGNFASGQHVVRARSRDAANNVSAWVSATVRFGGTVGAPAGFTKNEAWLVGLSAATAFAQAPDGRWFVAEQGGALRVVKGGGLLATPFATLAVDASGERGQLYIAVGDNANSARAQDLADPFGKLSRLDDDGTVPADHPFFGSVGDSPVDMAVGIDGALYVLTRGGITRFGAP
jgi:glucose/arabinose dehydrogenase